MSNHLAILLTDGTTLDLDESAWPDNGMNDHFEVSDDGALTLWKLHLRKHADGRALIHVSVDPPRSGVGDYGELTSWPCADCVNAMVKVAVRAGLYPTDQQWVLATLRELG